MHINCFCQKKVARWPLGGFVPQKQAVGQGFKTPGILSRLYRHLAEHKSTRTGANYKVTSRVWACSKRSLKSHTWKSTSFICYLRAVLIESTILALCVVAFPWQATSLMGIHPLWAWRGVVRSHWVTSQDAGVRVCVRGLGVSGKEGRGSHEYNFFIPWFIKTEPPYVSPQSINCRNGSLIYSLSFSCIPFHYAALAHGRK